MNQKERRYHRVKALFVKAKTGKYDWKQLKELALKIPVSNGTADEYLADVRAMLIKGGYIKNE